jgi:hypothetical protein
MTTIDLGHLIVTEPGARTTIWRSSPPRFATSRSTTPAAACHEHLVPGTGEIDFARSSRSSSG